MMITHSDAGKLFGAAAQETWAPLWSLISAARACLSISPPKVQELLAMLRSSVGMYDDEWAKGLEIREDPCHIAPLEDRIWQPGRDVHRDVLQDGHKYFLGQVTHHAWSRSCLHDMMQSTAIPDPFLGCLVVHMWEDAYQMGVRSHAWHCRSHARHCIVQMCRFGYINLSTFTMQHIQTLMVEIGWRWNYHINHVHRTNTVWHHHLSLDIILIILHDFKFTYSFLYIMHDHIQIFIYIILEIHTPRQCQVSQPFGWCLANNAFLDRRSFWAEALGMASQKQVGGNKRECNKPGLGAIWEWSPLVYGNPKPSNLEVITHINTG